MNSPLDSPTSSANQQRVASDSGLWGWLWQPQRSREIRRRLAAPSEAEERRRRARKLTSAGARLLESRVEGDAIRPIVRFLSQQSIGESLAAASISDEPALSQELTDELQQSLGPFESLEELSVRIKNQTLATEWSAPHEEQDTLRLHRLSARLLHEGDRLRREHEALWNARLFRLFLPLALFILSALAVGPVLTELRFRRQTSYPWTASSALASEPACLSPSQSCENSNFFFCTQEEENPWIQFDLGRPRAVTMVRIFNRTDCSECAARAVPLRFELSVDGNNWIVARKRKTSFESWYITLPETEARFVRLQVEGRNYFHLKNVQISTD